MTHKALAISIVIPVYNEEHHLAACLDSIIAQSRQPDEVIIVDNNSTDRSVEIARRYKFVRVVKQSRQGIVYARDAGFRAAKSELIGRIDADSRLPADWVARVLDFYSQPKHHSLALTGGCSFYNVRCPRVNSWFASQFVFRMNRFLMGYYILWGSNMALPKSLWQTVETDLCHRPDIHEDLDLAIHLHRQGYRIGYQSTLLVGVRMRRVFENRHQLWSNLSMWPRTLRVHKITKWPFSYLGSVFLYIAQIVPRSAERLAIWSGRPPLN